MLLVIPVKTPLSSSVLLRFPIRINRGLGCCAGLTVSGQAFIICTAKGGNRGELRILGVNGNRRVTWNGDSEDEIATAKRTFDQTTV